MKRFLTWPAYAIGVAFYEAVIWTDDHVVKRFRKREKIAQVQAKPGVGRIQLVRDGIVLADLMLVETAFDFRTGASARFVDHTHFMRRQTHDRHAG